MEKLDLTKKHKGYFTAKTHPEIAEIDPARFLSIQGKGDPSGKEFSERIQALYATAYVLKFIFKAEQKDFKISKLEALWWFDEQKYSGIPIADSAQKVPRSEWEYRLLIRLPDYVTQKEVESAIETVMNKKKLLLAQNISLFEMAEGKSVQMLHVGPFSTEAATLQEMETFMKSNNLNKNGFHHEIYLSDFNKTEPGKLKTILREPVK